MLGNRRVQANGRGTFGDPRYGEQQRYQSTATETRYPRGIRDILFCIELGPKKSNEAREWQLLYYIFLKKSTLIIKWKRWEKLQKVHGKLLSFISTFNKVLKPSYDNENIGEKHENEVRSLIQVFKQLLTQRDQGCNHGNEAEVTGERERVQQKTQ